MPRITFWRLVSLVAVAVVANAISPAASAQTIPAKGTSETFDIATWNIEFFGANGGPADDGVQFAHVLSVMRQSAIDFWAVQEISDPADFAALVDSLGMPYQGALATESGSQRIGFIYNTDLVSLRSNPKHILTAFGEHEFATRPPLQLEANVTIGDSTRALTFITVHMKCCGDPGDQPRRVAAAGRLKNHIDFTTLKDQPVIILGDFNDELGGSITSGLDTPYRNFLDDPANYRFITQPLNEDSRHTWCASSLCTSGSTLDHILITNELFADVEKGTADRFLELTQAIPGYVQNTSDHLPVYARVRYGIRTAIAGAQPLTFAVGNPYPNPASDHVVIPVTAGDQAFASTANIDVYDALGRRVIRHVRKVDAATREIRLSTGLLPQGLYHVRLATGADTATRSFVVAR